MLDGRLSKRDLDTAHLGAITEFSGEEGVHSPDLDDESHHTPLHYYLAGVTLTGEFRPHGVHIERHGLFDQLLKGCGR